MGLTFFYLRALRPTKNNNLIKQKPLLDICNIANNDRNYKFL